MKYLYFDSEGKLFLQGKEKHDMPNHTEIIVNDNVIISKKQMLDNDMEIDLVVNLDELINSDSYRLETAKQYLLDTDYKVLPDYDGDTTGILEARAEARALIRQLEVSNINE